MFGGMHKIATLCYQLLRGDRPTFLEHNKVYK